jgi:hypothetical protein
MATGSKITHREVIEYLKSISPEMRELVMDLVQKELRDHDAKRAALSARLVKARKGIGKRKQAATATTASSASTVTQADPNVQREVAEQLPVAQRGHRPRQDRGSMTNEVAAAAVE